MTDLKSEIETAQIEAQTALIKLFMLENPQSKLDILAFPVGEKITIYWPLDQTEKTKDVIIKGYSVTYTILWLKQLNVIFDVTTTHQRPISDLMDAIIDNEEKSS